jgi:ribosomal protein L16 Arg81 hydroxylase
MTQARWQKLTEWPLAIAAVVFLAAYSYEVIAEPGDTVFLPLGWWHQVRSLDVSLSFSYSNLAVPNQYSFKNPSIHNW